MGYDAILLISFGGPEGPDDVMPFLRNVTRGRGVPDERLAEVAEHYHHFGGVSPINQQNRDFLEVWRRDLVEAGIDLPVYWGNRNWDPYLTDVVATMRDDGVSRAIGFVTSAFSSYSGCRQYREDVLRAQGEVGAGAPVVDKLRVFYNHPGFISAQADRVRESLADLEAGSSPRLVFTAHSIPTSMAATSDYEAQLLEACRLVVDDLGADHDWDLVYQSRSGPPQVPWLEPDVGDHLRDLHTKGVEAVCIVPIGFVSDHMEVLFDLDEEAREVCEELGLRMVRAGTVGTHPAYVSMATELVRERMGLVAPRALGGRGPNHDVCPLDCCPAPTRRRGSRATS